MNRRPTVQLKAERVRFYSQKDEDAFFDWLKKINCVADVGGSGRTVLISVQSDRVDKDALIELLALFHRYGISKQDLVALERPEFSPWFRDKEKYWHAELFGKRS